MIGPLRRCAGMCAIAILIITAGCTGDGMLDEPMALTVESTPEQGANLTLGGIEYGPTPVNVQILRPGEVLAVLNKEGFRNTADIINITQETQDPITIELRPLVGYLTLHSKPDGASVYLDGDTLLGKTPLINKAVPVGKHTYELRLADYRTTPGELIIETDYRYTISREINPQAAKLSVISQPTGAKIWLNDEVQPEQTPALFEISPGAYTVGVHAKGYIMDEQNVLLQPNDDQSLEFSLKEGDAPPGMVLVPGGKFLMGGESVPDERPQREVQVEAFYIDKYEVTNTQFKQVFPAHVFDEGKERCPVSNVSFQQATDYAEALGKRLPTEAEWEKAARGTDGRQYPWGPDFQNDRCNFLGAGPDGPTPVGQYRLGASPYGCMDMAGNLYEWTASWYQAYPGNTDVQKEYGQIFRVLRGGCYKSDRFGVRCAHRHYDRMDTARIDYGFRCAKDVADGP